MVKRGTDERSTTSVIWELLRFHFWLVRGRSNSFFMKEITLLASIAAIGDKCDDSNDDQGIRKQVIICDHPTTSFRGTMMKSARAVSERF